jgi:hypothetical protein
MAIYSSDPPESILKKDAEHFKEDDSGEDSHSLTERPSSPSIEFKPLPAGSEYVVLDHDRDPTMISHDESLEMENPWAMKFCEAPTLGPEGKDFINEHGGFILEISQKPCPFNGSPESATLCTTSTYKDHNHLKILICKIFRRLVVDAFVYHKFCKFRGRTVGLTLQLKLSIIHQNWW